MRRLSDEHGIEAGVRNWGRLMLALIPWALGIGASVWLGVWIGAHKFRRELSQEERAAIVVGAEQRPTQKIKVDILGSCARITRADLDGSVLRLYAINECGMELSRLEWRYETLSPNGTLIDSGFLSYECPIPRLPGDKAECVFAGKYSGGYIETDDRVASMRVWTIPFRK